MAGRSRVPCDARGARGAPVPLEHPGSLQNSSEAASPGSSGNTAPPRTPRNSTPRFSAASRPVFGERVTCGQLCGPVWDGQLRGQPLRPRDPRRDPHLRQVGARPGAPSRAFLSGSPRAGGCGSGSTWRAEGTRRGGGARRAWGPQGRPEPLNSCPEPRWGDPRALKTPTLCLWRQAHGAWSIEIQDDRGRFAQPLCSSPTGGEPLTPGAQRCHPIKSNVGPKDFTRWPRIQQVTEGRGGGRGTARNSNVPKSRGN